MNGVESIPRFALARSADASDPNLPVNVTFLPSHHRFHMWGMDTEGSFSIDDESIGARFEAALTFRDNDRAFDAAPQFQSDLSKDKNIFAVAGVDYTYPENILGTTLYGNLQLIYFQKIGPHESRDTGESVVQGLPQFEPFDRNSVLFLECRLSSNYKFTHTFLWSFKNHDFLITPAFEGVFEDNFTAKLSADFFGGERGRFLRSICKQP